MNSVICGVDEAGRGPLVGSVVAAAVILPPEGILGLRDSKKLTSRKREILYAEIIARAQYGIGEASAEEIDTLNIFRATMLAMRRAIQALGVEGVDLKVDGNRLPDLTGLGVAEAQALVKGDSLVPAISAASILAKVTRDRQMQLLDQEFPMYGFKGHQGYPTPEHLAALREHGPCVWHRKSFRPVKEAFQ